MKRIKNVVLRKASIIFLIAGFALGCVYGFLSYRLTLPPYTLFMKTYLSALTIKNENDPQRVSDVTDDELVAKVKSVLQINSAETAMNKRRELLRILWGEGELPDRAELDHTQNIQTDRYSQLTGVSTVDELTIEMEYGIQSTIHLLHPEDPNGELVIYHQGHIGDFIAGSELIGRFLTSGFTVMGVSMPLLGLNNNPVVDLSIQGSRALTEHNQLPFLALDKGIAVKFFVEPIVVSLNYLKAFSDIHMVGISGGGWTTTLLAAIDGRITNSFSVAGTEPLMFSEVLPTEYEQVTPELYSRVSYFDLYLLSAIGRGRSHVQAHNAFDPCCNRGEKTNVFVNLVKQRVSESGGGEFEIIIDDTHAEHKISEYMADYILGKLVN